MPHDNALHVTPSYSMFSSTSGVDNEAKEIVIRLLNKTVSLASTIEVESPQQLLDFCTFAVGSMGAIVNVSRLLSIVVD